MKVLRGSLSNRRNSPAFTLVELAVLLALIVVGACMLARAAAHTGPDVRAGQCLSNLRRLLTAWQMYASDNRDRLVLVVHGGASRGGAGEPGYGMGWVEGWL